MRLKYPESAQHTCHSFYAPSCAHHGPHNVGNCVGLCGSVAVVHHELGRYDLTGRCLYGRVTPVVQKLNWKFSTPLGAIDAYPAPPKHARLLPLVGSE